MRDWEPQDRKAAAAVISSVLAEYGLGWEPLGADLDVLEVEKCYQNCGGAFWVAETGGEIVGTGAYYPIHRGTKAVEIRKIYLLPRVRGQGLGKFLLQELETAIIRAGFQEIWVETTSAMVEVIGLYESSGYIQTTGVETARCDPM
ncbi:MAG: GNAT family N-acetyltransferase [Oscillatoriaceae cyanobacterium]